MIAFSLQSGSNGNSIFVEAGGMRLLFDAGLSGKNAEARLREKGIEIRSCDALLISHDHSDHIRSAGILQRKYGIPLWITEKTLKASRGLGRLREVRRFRSGGRIEIGPVTVHTIPTPHDGADGVAFVVEHGGKRLGILTDLGHPFARLASILPELDGAFLESNYDPEMMEKGSYPPSLKARIRGSGGHLSNMESAVLVKSSIPSRLRWIAIAHLSEENNHPDLALATHRASVGRDFPIHIASRYGPSGILEIG